MKPAIIAIAGFSQNEFYKVRAMAKDGGGMDKTFEEWRANVEQHVASLRAQGLNVRPVQIKADALARWLASGNVESSNESRSRFVHDLVSAKYADKH